MYKLGIDVGGTNTDAVLIDENRKVVAERQAPHHPATPTTALWTPSARCWRRPAWTAGQIGQAMLGTTQCTNAIVERKHLAPIGVLRIGAPATVGIPPMVDWAEDLKAIGRGQRRHRRRL